MAEKIVALLGGDQRELLVAPALLDAGFGLRTFGLPAAELPAEAKACASLNEAAQGADLLLLPLPGVRENGRLHTAFLSPPLVTTSDLAGAAAGTPVMVGVASKYLRGLCQALQLPLYEIAEADEVAVPNAIPTAEGALQLAMQQLPVTIQDLPALVLGFGRVGAALAERLRALGAEVWVANRGAERLQKARRQGYAVCAWEQLAAELGRFAAVFNTVPALVLPEERLQAMRPGALIIDLASGSGGTDFAAAEKLGLAAVHALSLPGKVAPQTAGQLLAHAYPRLIKQVLASEQEERSEFWGRAVKL